MPPLYLMPRTEVPVVMGRVVASEGAVRPDEVEGWGRAREEVPPDWRERDMVRRKMKRRTVIVENDKLGW